MSLFEKSSYACLEVNFYAEYHNPKSGYLDFNTFCHTKN